MSWFALLMLVAQAATSTPAAPPASVPAYVPERVYDTRKNAFADFELMLADLATADVIFVGEQHDDPNTHRLELGMLEGLRRRRVPVIVSLEMFERDVQAAVDRYLSGAMVEAEFLKDARPWPRYATDYRPLVELAKAHGWPVVAANVPRRFASEVAKSGQAGARSALRRRSRSRGARAASARRMPTSIASPRRWASHSTRAPSPRSRRRSPTRRSAPPPTPPNATTGRSA